MESKKLIAGEVVDVLARGKEVVDLVSGILDYQHHSRDEFISYVVRYFPESALLIDKYPGWSSTDITKIKLVGGEIITAFINKKLLPNFYTDNSSEYVVKYRTVMDALKNGDIVTEPGKPYRLDITSAWAAHNAECDLMGNKQISKHTRLSYRQIQRRKKTKTNKKHIPVDRFLGTDYSCTNSCDPHKKIVPKVCPR